MDSKPKSATIQSSVMKGLSILFQLIFILTACAPAGQITPVSDGQPAQVSSPASPGGASTPQSQTSTQGSEPTSPAVSQTTPVSELNAGKTPRDITLQYFIDRKDIPALTYNDLTLKIYVGKVSSVTAKGDDLANIPVKYDPSSGFATVTTNGNALELSLTGAILSPKLGTFTKAALKDDKQWAWSHSFDDNAMFKAKGIPAFEKYGWRATVYLIGNKIEDNRNENWIIDRPDIIQLVKKGWGIGNHTMSHKYVKDIGQEKARQEIIQLADYLRKAVDAAGRTDYRLISFAAPDFDGGYFPIIQSLRNSHTTEILFDEAGDGGMIRVDPGAKKEAFPIFKPDSPLGRDWRVEVYQTGNSFDKSFQSDLNKMISSLNADHHYWLNTFMHWSDDKKPQQSIFAFLTWVYTNYGPGGKDNVWVAPSEEIYSYLLVRDRSKVSMKIVTH